MRVSRELPILCAGPVVRAILEGRQTQDRRPVKPPRARKGYGEWSPVGPFVRDRTDLLDPWFEWQCGYAGSFGGAPFERVKSPYGPVGTVLYVQETWMDRDGDGRIIYAADLDHCGQCPVTEPDGSRLWITPKGPWRPSIHMRKEHARIHLRVLSVGVERVNAISEEDARAEGCEPSKHDHVPLYSSVATFERLWDSLYGRDPALTFASSPWVWVTRFERVAR